LEFPVNSLLPAQIRVFWAKFIDFEIELEKFPAEFPVNPQEQGNPRRLHRSLSAVRIGYWPLASLDFSQALYSLQNL